MAFNLLWSSPTWLAVAVAVCLSAIGACRLLKIAYLTPLRHVPGPAYAHWTNLVLKYNVVRGRRTMYIHSLHAKYGPYVRISPSEVAVCDVVGFRTMHRVGSDFRKSDWYGKFNDMKVPGVFAMTDPKAHGARRRLFAQQLSNTAVLRYEETVRAKVELALDKIGRDAGVGNADILKWWTAMATDVAAELSFGSSFGILEHESKGQYMTDLETTMLISGVKVELPCLVGLASFVPVKALQDALRLPQRLAAYGRWAIERHKEAVARDPDLRSIFARFLDPKRQQSEISDEEIAIEAANFIVAGSDTTAVSLTYLVWAVLRPASCVVREKLCEEVASLPTTASARDIGALPYLGHVVTETLRLYGAAPGSLPRVVPGDGAILGDVYVPGGVTVSTQAYSIHRDPTVFPDPHTYGPSAPPRPTLTRCRFCPERWENATQQMKDAYHPFGAGARSELHPS